MKNFRDRQKQLSPNQIFHFYLFAFYGCLLLATPLLIYLESLSGLTTTETLLFIRGSAENFISPADFDTRLVDLHVSSFLFLLIGLCFLGSGLRFWQKLKVFDVLVLAYFATIFLQLTTELLLFKWPTEFLASLHIASQCLFYLSWLVCLSLLIWNHFKHWTSPPEAIRG